MIYLEEQQKYNRDHPLAEAAEEVRALAAKGREMLEQVQSSRLWSLLFIPRVQKLDE